MRGRPPPPHPRPTRRRRALRFRPPLSLDGLLRPRRPPWRNRDAFGTLSSPTRADFRVTLAVGRRLVASGPEAPPGPEAEAKRASCYPVADRSLGRSRALPRGALGLRRHVTRRRVDPHQGSEAGDFRQARPQWG